MVLKKKIGKSKKNISKNNKNSPLISKEENPKISGYYTIILFLLFMIIDRITKIWALTSFNNKPLDLGILEFVYVTNTGAGFSILQNQNVLLSWIAVIVLGIIIFYYEQFPRLGFLMIISGIIGNLMDRVMYGYVIDFINFRIWPIFNVADSLVFLGVAYTIIIWIKKDIQEKKEEKKNNQERNKVIKTGKRKTVKIRR